MILLDSNQLRFVLPGSPALKLLSAVAKRAGHSLATTDIVVAEVVRQRRDELQSALSQLARAQRVVNSLIRSDNRATSLYPTHQERPRFADKEVDGFEASLRETFQVLETAPEDALDAHFREAGHRAPCSNGTGGRDATIWLTACRAALSPEVDAAGTRLPVIFVSKDRGFAAPKDPTAFSAEPPPWLTNSKALLLRPTVIDALAELGYPRKVVDAEQITSRLDFQQALLDAVLPGADLSPGQPKQPGQQPEMVIRPLSGNVAHQCRGEGATITSLTGTWSIKAVTERRPRRADGRIGGERRAFAIRVETLALIVDDETREESEIEFTPIQVSESQGRHWTGLDFQWNDRVNLNTLT